MWKSGEVALANLDEKLIQLKYIAAISLDEDDVLSTIA
jgi:hypothetical protein